MKNKLTARELSSFCGQMGMLLHSGISTAEGPHTPDPFRGRKRFSFPGS